MDRTNVNWKGNFTAVVTPFTKEGTVDEKLFQENIDLLIQEGIDGIIVAGCTGEFWALSDDERVRLFELGLQVARGRTPVIAGTSYPLTEQVVSMSLRAKRIGVDGIMVTPPYYILPNEREILEHYHQISTQVGLPILVYNIPKRVGVTISPKFAAQLAEIDCVVAIKQSAGDFEEVVEVVRLCGKQILVFAGHSVTRGFPCVAMGTDGFVSSVEPQVMGKEAIDLYTLSISGNTEASRELQYRLIELDHAVHGIGTFPAALKVAMNLLGRPGGFPRRPILPLSGEEMEQLRNTLETLNLPKPLAKQ